MKLIAISDTHTKHKQLTIPECDVLVHCGDFTWTGRYQEVQNFRDWFLRQPARHKIVIAGNHEETFDDTTGRYNGNCHRLISQCKGINYLENSAITIDGVKFYGTPWTPWFYDWAFNGVTDKDASFRRGTLLSAVYGDIPEDTNILICHGPAYNLADRNSHDGRCGSVEMRRLLESGKLASLQLYLCGHIHEARGHEIDCGGVHFCNVSTLDRDYETVSPPVIINLDANGLIDSVQGYDK